MSNENGLIKRVIVGVIVTTLGGFTTAWIPDVVKYPEKYILIIQNLFSFSGPNSGLGGKWPLTNNNSASWYRIININELDTLNMRKKASTKSPIVYEIPFNEDCILGTEETQMYLNKVWLKIKVNNRTGWVNSEFLSATNSSCGAE